MLTTKQRKTVQQFIEKWIQEADLTDADPVLILENSPINIFIV